MNIGVPRNFNHYLQHGVQTTLQADRERFLNMTPEQRGEYMSGYSYGPARWSVYG